VTVDRTTTGDTGAKVAEEPPAPERPPCPMSLAWMVRHLGRTGAAVKDEPEPATDSTESPGEGTEGSEYVQARSATT
jgi:hypothetical protein